MNELKYIYNNFSVVRCNSKKTATQKHTKEDYQKLPWEDILHNDIAGGSTAILCGERSGNMEMLDFDTKNARDPKTFYDTFCELVLLKLGATIIERMTIQRSPSGGYHWIYTTDKVDGNKKICKGENKQAIIESRGSGGYFIVAPSKGYTVISGRFDNLQYISEEVKKQLWDIAASLSEYEEPEIIIRKEVVKTHGALTNIAHSANGQINYWEEFDKNCDFHTMLERDGWTTMKPKGDRFLMRRPDKDDASWSADYHPNHQYGKLLYVYTTSTVLESEKAYLPSTYLIEWHCNGDTIRAYDWLIDHGYAPSRKEKIEVKEMDAAPETKNEADNIFAKYEEYRIDEKTKIERPVPIVTINGVGVLHTGEILILSGESKSGKSALVSAINARVLNANSEGFEIIKTERTDLPILHFDTEQPVHRHQDSLKNSVMKRAGLSSLPAQFMSYNLRRLSKSERKLMVSELIESARIKFGGVFLVVLDGIADFVLDTNSNSESEAIVSWVLAISTEYNCGLIGIIHLNPSPDGYVKQRGHLGSELQRKADSILVVKVDVENEEESIITAHYLRNGGKREFGKHAMYFDRTTNMHQLVETSSDSFALSESQKVESICRQIKGLTKPEAIKKLFEQGDYKSLKLSSTAIKEFVEVNYIAFDENDKIVSVVG